MATGTFKVQGFELQKRPRIYVAMIPGKWLLKRTTPSWRIEDPDKGFQRIVREERAREIALAVLEQQRTFPNSIVLATDKADFQIINCEITIPAKIKFLVVDGQHRLWAQHYSNFEAMFCCMVHVGLSEVEMARLFLEINDNQKRVPSSLRWDLVRLVRPDDDPYGIAAVEMVYLLATEEESPLFQRIDLTGEQSEILLKQGSLAPDIKNLVSKRSPLHDLSFEEQYRLTLHFLAAIRDLDADNWGKTDSLFYGARVLRALLRLFPDIVRHTRKMPTKLNYQDFTPYLRKIDKHSLVPQQVKDVG